MTDLLWFMAELFVRLILVFVIIRPVDSGFRRGRRWPGGPGDHGDCRLGPVGLAGKEETT